jgi:DNA-binding XRE family transcriptional regulator
MKFGDLLRIKRKEAKVTQQNFGKHMGVSAATMVAYEKNQVSPRLDLAVKMAKELNFSLDILFKEGAQ